MGYFAIVRVPKDPTGFEVVACHLNVWSLSASFKRRVFFWDVGIRLRAGEKEITNLSLALPVRVHDKEANGIEDLHDLIVNPKAAELIFNRPVTVNGSIITYPSSTVVDGKTVATETQLKASRIIIGETKLDENLSGRDFSFWTISLASPVKRGEPDTYIRIRFLVRDVGRIWTWKKSSFVKNGALVDIRVSDIRGSFVEKVDWSTFQDRIIPIPQLSLFVIAPSWLQLRAVSPDYHYLRLFEGRVWEKYLRRRVDLKRREKLIIYQWRNSKPVDTNNSFHIMCDLSKESGLLSIRNHLLTAVLVLFLLLLTNLLVLSYPSYVNYVEPPIGWIQDKVTNIAVASVLGSLVLVLWALYRFRERFEKTSQFLRNWLLQREQRRYRKNLEN
jgi:hypothetical protein